MAAHGIPLYRESLTPFLVLLATIPMQARGCNTNLPGRWDASVTGHGELHEETCGRRARMDKCQGLTTYLEYAWEGAVGVIELGAGVSRKALGGPSQERF